MTRPQSNLPNEVRGMEEQKYHPDCDSLPSRISVVCNSVGSSMDAFISLYGQGNPTGQPVEDLPDGLVEDLYYRIGLRFSSRSICVAALKLFNIMGQLGWKYISVGEVNLSIDSFCIHTLEYIPDEIHYVQKLYGNNYTLVELLEDSKGLIGCHHILSSGGFVIDPAGASRGAFGHRDDHVFESDAKWINFIKRYPSLSHATIRPVPEHPKWVSEYYGLDEKRIDNILTAVIS